jgi:hypothetical protein
MDISWVVDTPSAVTGSRLRRLIGIQQEIFLQWVYSSRIVSELPVENGLYV